MSVVWHPNRDRAKEMAEYCANSAPTPRFSWAGPGSHEPARVLVEPEEGDLTRSAEWVVINDGDRVERLAEKDQDSPLRVIQAQGEKAA